MTFKRILIPLDGSQLAEESLPHAKRVARAFGSQVQLLHVLRTQPTGAEACADSVDWRLHRLEIQSYLKRVAEQFTRLDIPIEYHVTEGRPAEQIVEFTGDHQIDLMVLSAYGWGGITQFPLGSTVQKILSVPCASQMIIRPHLARAEDASYQRILVPIDGSQRAEWAIGLAASLARAQKAELILLQVIQVPEMLRRTPMTTEEAGLRSRFVDVNRVAAEHYLNEVSNRFQDGITIHTRLLVSNTVGSTIRQVAEKEGVDLIALSAHGGTENLETSSGSICQTILAHSNRPVLVFQDQPHDAVHPQVVPGVEVRPAQLVYGI